ncbi:OspC3 [Providencia burhodogranariea DSM 19968]|uniref:OspC3 n=1 Tax=Providencia burhodogranariea DSM 19968 TaxID=1141662 RepID=K8WQT6_9GAMM|nr:OspC3 [Providencia burhodogranariea DSM 19968]
MNEMSYGIDIEYELSDSCGINNKILEKVLQLGLIDPNKRFEKISTGNTMLDNAIKNGNKDMINLLLEHGAMTGNELEKINFERYKLDN